MKGKSIQDAIAEVTLPKSPERRLSELMLRACGISLDPFLLRLFLTCHWSKVSMLAHRIHDECVAEPRNFGDAT